MKKFILAMLLGMPVFAAPVKIGFVLATMQEERYQKDKKYFEDAAKKLGAVVEFADCKNSESEQVKQVENILSRGVQALVIQPVNSDATSSLVELASARHVPVIAYDRLIKNSKDLEWYVTQDSYAVGKLQAEAAVKALGGKGNVIILEGQAGHSVAKEITRGVKETIAKYPGMKVVLSQPHEGWSGSKAMTTVQNVLTREKNNVQAILANNSGMANGAVQALEEAGFFDKNKKLGNVFVAGADADLAAIRNIVAGKQQFEVLKAIEPLATKSAELAVKLARKEAAPATTVTMNNGSKDVKVLATPVFSVDRNNIDTQIVGTGFHTKKEIYGTN